MRLGTLVTLALIPAAPLAAEDRLLFDFSPKDGENQWSTVNDGVMGGRSTGRHEIGESGTLAFSGILSLANRGGFASVRSARQPLGLEKGDSLVIRTRGDGRRYNVNLYVPGRRIAFSYRADLPTKDGEWTEVAIPLSEFQATSFGRIVRNMPLDPSQVVGIGVLLGDEKAGPFQLEVDWVKVTAG